MYKTVVIKVGTRLLTSGGEQINAGVIESLTEQIVKEMRKGRHIVLVSSGAVTAGLSVVAKKPKQRSVVIRQVLASLGQPILMQMYGNVFRNYGIATAQVLISRDDLQSRSGYLNVRQTLNALLENGNLPVVNENDTVAVHEILTEAYGDNDRLAAMVANAVDADILILLGETDGLYTADPKKHSEAVHIPSVKQIGKYIKDIAQGTNDSRASGGMASKIEAAALTTSSGIPLVIASGNTSSVIGRLLSGEKLGTYFVPTVSRMEARKRWMVTGIMEQKGSIAIDSGAKNAVFNRGMSILPVGITSVKGNFQRGDIIGITGNDNALTVGYGVSNYSADDVLQIKNTVSERIASVLGYSYGSAVIHRNNMVLLVSN